MAAILRLTNGASLPTKRVMIHHGAGFIADMVPIAPGEVREYPRAGDAPIAEGSGCHATSTLSDWTGAYAAPIQSMADGVNEATLEPR